jgi:hypothetical protein
VELLLKGPHILILLFEGFNFNVNFGGIQTVTDRKRFVSKLLLTLNPHLLSYFFEIGSHCVAQTALEIKILLPQLPEYWDYRCEPFHVAFVCIFVYFFKSVKKLPQI